MSLLELPTEIIQEVASLLDWTKDEICPTKPDIVNLSLTCSRIRQAIISFVFKDVTLRLRWQNGSLAEPCLYKLRLHHPHLAGHIRSICIRTNFEDDGLNPQGSQNLKTFVAPRERPNWLDLASDSSPVGVSTHDDFRQRANKAAQKFRSSRTSPQQDSEVTAEKILGDANALQSKHQAGIDALTIGQPEVSFDYSACSDENQLCFVCPGERPTSSSYLCDNATGQTRGTGSDCPAVCSRQDSH